MKRNIRLEDISDGNLYTANDMVRADCHDCKGCSACCRGMGTSIILDPLDVHRLCAELGKSLEELLQKNIELNLVDGVILPNLKMSGVEESCSFLDENGRCSIHSFRPGICRLFPLGRYYEEGGFRYFLQIHECQKTDRSKIKVKKWISMPDLKAYEEYILVWHRFLKVCEGAMETLDDESQRIFQLYILRTFYQTAYGQADVETGDFRLFYTEFYERMEKLKERLGLESEVNGENNS